MTEPERPSLIRELDDARRRHELRGFVRSWWAVVWAWITGRV